MSTPTAVTNVVEQVIAGLAEATWDYLADIGWMEVILPGGSDRGELPTSSVTTSTCASTWRTGTRSVLSSRRSIPGWQSKRPERSQRRTLPLTMPLRVSAWSMYCGPARS